jgi:hypothetical protein
LIQILVGKDKKNDVRMAEKVLFINESLIDEGEGGKFRSEKECWFTEFSKRVVCLKP